MTKKSEPIEAFLAETEPHPEQISRAKAKLRTSWSSSGEVKELLGALPDPEAAAAARVKARLRTRTATPMRRWMFGLAAAAAIALVIAVLSQPPEPPPQKQELALPEPPPAEAPPIPKEEIAVSTRAELGRVEAFGTVDAKGAQAALAAIEPKLNACLDAGSETGDLRIALSVGSEGEVRGVKLDGDRLNGTVRRCLEAALASAKFQTTGDVVAGPDRTPASQGVIRAELGIRRH